jgi:hypothetical protein
MRFEGAESGVTAGCGKEAEDFESGGGAGVDFTIGDDWGGELDGSAHLIAQAGLGAGIEFIRQIPGVIGMQDSGAAGAKGVHLQDPGDRSVGSRRRDGGRGAGKTKSGSRAIGSGGGKLSID